MRAIARLFIFLIGMIGLTGFSATDQSQNSKDAFVKVDKTIDKADVVNLLKVDIINVISDVSKTDARVNKAHITNKYRVADVNDIYIVSDVGKYSKPNIRIQNYLILKEAKHYKENTCRRARDGLVSRCKS